MTTAQMEEYVRQKWEHVIVCDGSYRHYAKGTVLFNWANHCFYEFPDFAAGYAFTLTREEEIRQVEREIAMLTWIREKALLHVRNWFDAPGLHPAHAGQLAAEKTLDVAVLSRILAREQAALDALKMGLREVSK
jgi:hypothetical protein